MKKRFEGNVGARLITLLIIVLPLLILFLLPAGSMAGVLWFWPLAFFAILIMWLLLGRPSDDRLPAFAGPRQLRSEEHPGSVRRFLNVEESIEVPPGVQIFRGTLRGDADHVFSELKKEIGPETVPLLQPESHGRTSLMLIPNPVEAATMERPIRPWLHWLLFGLTFLTTTFAGAAHRESICFGIRDSSASVCHIQLHCLRYSAVTSSATTSPRAPWNARHAPIFHTGSIRARHVWSVHTDALPR